MREIFLQKTFQELWQGKDPFQAAFELTGESFRKVKSRHTFRIEVHGKGYFVKLHRGCGIAEYLKNILQFKRAVTGAWNEYHALRHLETAGVPAMTPAAYGCRGFFPPYRTSFLITEELTDTVSLEDFCKDWNINRPSIAVKRALLRQIGTMTGKMHRSGMNHKDCYICHFLLKKNTIGHPEPELHVIDLHRAEIRSKVPHHYLVKDLAGLWFSSMDAGLSRRDLLRFLCAYYQQPVRQILTEHRALLSSINKTAIHLYRKVHGRNPSFL